MGAFNTVLREVGKVLGLCVAVDSFPGIGWGMERGVQVGAAAAYLRTGLTAGWLSACFAVAGMMVIAWLNLRCIARVCSSVEFNEKPLETFHFAGIGLMFMQVSSPSRTTSVHCQ